MATIPDTIGVIAAGTMGAGIAQLAAQAGALTLLHDPVPEARPRFLRCDRRRTGRALAPNALPGLGANTAPT